MKKIGIYKITSPSKRIYIGQGLDIDRRWNEYRLLHCKTQTRLYNSLKKYGFDKHKFEIVQLCEKEQLNELEKYYVDLFQTFNNKYGLNLRDGGGNKCILSDETKKRMSESSKGMKHTSETKLKISQWQIGKIVSNETKLKISNSHKGKQTTLGRKHSEETKRKIGDKSQKIIINIETGIFYFGIQEVSLIYKINHSTLRNKLNGSTKNNTNFRYV